MKNQQQEEQQLPMIKSTAREINLCSKILSTFTTLGFVGTTLEKDRILRERLTRAVRNYSFIRRKMDNMNNIIDTLKHSSQTYLQTTVDLIFAAQLVLLYTNNINKRIGSFETIFLHVEKDNDNTIPVVERDTAQKSVMKNLVIDMNEVTSLAISNVKQITHVLKTQSLQSLYVTFSHDKKFIASKFNKVALHMCECTRDVSTDKIICCGERREEL